MNGNSSRVVQCIFAKKKPRPRGESSGLLGSELGGNLVVGRETHHVVALTQQELRSIAHSAAPNQMLLAAPNSTKRCLNRKQRSEEITGVAYEGWAATAV